MKKLIYLVFIILFCSACDNVECPEGSTKTGNKCYNIEYSESTEKLACEEGFSLIDNKCTKEEKRDANYNTSCPSGYTNYSDIGCAIIEDKNPQYRWVCKDDGLYVDGALCMKISNVTSKMQLYTCPSNTTISGGGCKSTYVDGKTLYSCPSKPDCVSYSSYTMTFNQQTQGAVYMQCMLQSGTPNGTICNIQKYEQSIFVKYGCPAGDILVNDACYETTYVKAAEQEFYCQSGFELTSGRGCRKITKANAIKNYYCNNNERLDGNLCLETLIGSNPKNIFTCSDEKATLDKDNKCLIKTEVEPIK